MLSSAAGAIRKLVKGQSIFIGRILCNVTAHTTTTTTTQQQIVAMKVWSLTYLLDRLYKKAQDENEPP